MPIKTKRILGLTYCWRFLAVDELNGSLLQSSAFSKVPTLLSRVMTSVSNSGSGPNLRFRLSAPTGFFLTTPLLNIDITKLQKKESSLFQCVYFGSTLSTYSSSFIDIVLTLQHSVIEAWFIRFKPALLRL